MKKFLLFLLTFLSIQITSSANATDLSQVLQQAFVSDQTYQQAVSQRLSDQQGVPISLAYLLPNLYALATPTIVKRSISGADQVFYNSGNTSRGYDFQLDVTQTVFDFGKFANLCQARALSRASDATLNAATQTLMVNVAKAYFAILEDQDNLRYSGANKEAYAKQLDQVNQQYKVGLKTITDVYTAQASYDGAVADYIATENQLANDKENLRVITGILYSHFANLSEDFPLVTPKPNNMESWVQTAIHQSWYIKSAQFGAQAASENIRQQYAGHMPTASLQGIYDVNFMRQVSGNALLSPTGATKTVSRTVNLNINIPIYQGGLVVAQTRKAQYDYQVKSAVFEKQLRDTINLTRQSYLGIISGISKIKADKQAVKSNLSSLEGMNEGYRVGTETLVNVLNQQKQLFQAQKQYASDRYAFVNDLLALKQAAGTLSVEDIAAINSWLRENSESRSDHRAYKDAGGFSKQAMKKNKKEKVVT